MKLSFISYVFSIAYV